MNQKYVMEHGLLSAITEYLATKPYREVANLIGAIQQDVKPVEQEGNKNADVHE